MSSHDFRSKPMNKTQALRKVREIMGNGGQVLYRKHALQRMRERNILITDVENVLRSKDSRITDEPEVAYGNLAYRLKTNDFCVVISFTRNADGLFVITVFEINKG